MKRRLRPSSIFDSEEILKGRKEIMAFLKVKSWRTIKRYRDECHLPILRWINGRPIALKSELLYYIMAFNKILEERSKEEKDASE